MKPSFLNASFLLKTIVLLFICSFLVSCFGPRLNKRFNDQEFSKEFSLFTGGEDENIKIELNYLLVRNSHGSWAKDAKWDEYIFSAINKSNKFIEITKITVFDSLEYETLPKTTRKELLKATKLMKKRYRKAGIKIKLGNGSTRMLAESIGGTLVGAGIGASIASGGGITVSAATFTTAGGAVLVAAPAILIGGIVKAMNNGKINKEIQRRQSSFPVPISKKSSSVIDVFYSAIPSPRGIKIEYLVNNEARSLEVPLGNNFEGLHYKNNSIR